MPKPPRVDRPQCQLGDELIFLDPMSAVEVSLYYLFKELNHFANKSALGAVPFLSNSQNARTIRHRLRG